MHKLPQCVRLLSEVTENVEQVQSRRVIWAAEELQNQELPIQVWRLRRLAGLPDQCTANVEDLLIKTANQLRLVVDNRLRIRTPVSLPGGDGRSCSSHPTLKRSGTSSD